MRAKAPMSPEDPELPGAGSKRRAWVLSGILGIGILLALAYYLVNLVLAESLYTERGTIAYHLLIADVIQDVPLVGIAGEPQFHSSAGDGPKPPSSSIHYRSRADEAAIRQEIGAFLRAGGFAVQGAEEDNPAFWLHKPGEVTGNSSGARRAGSEISVSISAGEGGTSDVSVTMIMPF